LIFLLDDVQNWQSATSGPRIGEFDVMFCSLLYLLIL